MAKKKFKYLEIVVFDPEWAKKKDRSRKPYGIDKEHPLKLKEQVLYLGDIPNAQGHCAVAKFCGDVIWLLHPQDFRKATEEEV